MVVKSKNTSKRLDKLETTTNLKSKFYEDKEMIDIMKKNYEIERNSIILSIFSKNIIDTELKISTYTNISTSYPMVYHSLF